MSDFKVTAPLSSDGTTRYVKAIHEPESGRIEGYKAAVPAATYDSMHETTDILVKRLIADIGYHPDDSGLLEVSIMSVLLQLHARGIYEKFESGKPGFNVLYDELTQGPHFRGPTLTNFVESHTAQLVKYNERIMKSIDQGSMRDNVTMPPR